MFDTMTIHSKVGTTELFFIPKDAPPKLKDKVVTIVLRELNVKNIKNQAEFDDIIKECRIVMRSPNNITMNQGYTISPDLYDKAQFIVQKGNTSEELPSDRTFLGAPATLHADICTKVSDKFREKFPIPAAKACCIL